MITPIRLTTTGSPTHGGRLPPVDDLSLDLNHLGVRFGTIFSNLHRKKILIGRDEGFQATTKQQSNQSKYTSAY